MNALLRVFVELCLLRAGPQQLPASVFLLGLALVAYGVSGLLLIGQDYSLSVAVGYVVLDGLILLGFLQLGLSWIGKQERFLQTATAAAGAGALITLVALPATLWLLQAREQQGNTDTPTWLLFFLMVWNLAVLGNILRHALGTTWMGGVLLALVYMVLSLTILGIVFPYEA